LAVLGISQNGMTESYMLEADKQDREKGLVGKTTISERLPRKVCFNLIPDNVYCQAEDYDGSTAE
jgi:hypothetical protein